MTCKEFDNPREEYMCVVAALKKRMERGEDLLNTAILLRTNQESEGLINVLMEYQVPFTMKEQLPNLFRTGSAGRFWLILKWQQETGAGRIFWRS